MGSIVMNMAANMLGLDNAATPLGLKAMKELQEINPEPEQASNDQILFLVLNTSAVTVIPITIFVYRAQMGAADPTDVFIPMLIATFCSTIVGLTVTAAVQRLRLWEPVILAYLGGLTAMVLGMILYFSRLDREMMELQSSVLSNFVIFSIIVSFVFLAARRKLPLYDVFVEGAKDGFKVAVGIIPYLVGYALGRGPADGADASPVRERRARTHARSHGGSRRRLLRRSPGERDPGQHRNHLLRARGLLRFGGNPPHPPRSAVRPRGGCRGGHRRDPHLLSLLRLELSQNCHRHPLDSRLISRDKMNPLSEVSLRNSAVKKAVLDG
jgi:hypothetical protein